MFCLTFYLKKSYSHQEIIFPHLVQQNDLKRRKNLMHCISYSPIKNGIDLIQLVKTFNIWRKKEVSILHNNFSNRQWYRFDTLWACEGILVLEKNPSKFIWSSIHDCMNDLKSSTSSSKNENKSSARKKQMERHLVINFIAAKFTD